MAVLGGTALTYMDWAKRLDDNYKIASIIELLSQTNEILGFARHYIATVAGLLDRVAVVFPAASPCFVPA